MNWIELNSMDQLRSAISESAVNPVLIFKHSTTCSISRMALDRLTRNFDNQGFKAYLLDLKSHRDISNQIAESFDVIHESPQVLIIDDGHAVYHRSHYDIDAGGIRKAFEAAKN